MIISHVFSIVGLVIASIMGIYAQDITYFLNEKYPELGLGVVITVLTLMSISLFLIIFIKNFKKIPDKTSLFYVYSSLFIGVPISSFSFFVWAMWMG
ncbi:MAG TPA: hypothetical protein VNM69_16235 [Bacillus sp. (in: firmicutes)]|nr:hypothetical protein [Bacillus sp. (in: firmicutes)]